LSGFEKRVRDEFKSSSVIANWGKRKAYIVNDVVFDRNPHTSLFEYNGSKISVAEYFSKLYGKKCTDDKQPLFECKAGGISVHLPTEFCTIDGVPASIRSDPMKMAGVLKQCRKNPEEKFREINDFCKTLGK
jgi:hypothetical protein